VRHLSVSAPAYHWQHGRRGAIMACSDGTRDVSRYYDSLYLWSQLTTRFRAFQTVGAHMIHRQLTDPDTGEHSGHVVHRLIARAAAGLGAIDALDAGCGYGGTCLDLNRMLGGRWLGITVNKRQLQLARRNAEAMGVADAVSFALVSYDAPLPCRFNLVIGIESLIHSPAPAATVANLAAALLPGGIFIIVDDMLAEPVSPQHAADIAGFKRMWRCPAMPTDREWIQHLEAAGCPVEAVSDLTPRMSPRPEAEVAAELAAVARRRRWRDRLGLSLVSDAQAGGLILERLTRQGASRYTMIAARKR
jgi:SAM-dependent methyltransferase